MDLTTDGLTLTVEELGACYPLNIDPLAQQAYIKASNTEAGDRFGASVSMSGDTIVVGAYGEDSNATGIDGNQNSNSAPESGAAYVFVRNGGTWSQQAYLKASNPDPGDQFGFSVFISGDTIVIGANGEDGGSSGVNGNENNNALSGAGAAYVFVRSGSTWSQQAYLKASNPRVNFEFGSSVSASGDTIVVGSIGESSASTGVNGSQAPSSMTYAGAAYVFVRSGTSWGQQAYLKASNTETNDSFGASVSISGDLIAVGAWLEGSTATGVNGIQANNGAPQSGAVYVYIRSGITWVQQAYVKASNTGIGDSFGYSVAMTGETLVVGAVNESSGASGVNGNQNDNSAMFAGAAYVFVNSGPTWVQQAYLKASNPGPGDYLGSSVSVAGDKVIVGAYGEDSIAIGIDGDQGSNAAVNSGAAYLFERSGSAWNQLAYIKASSAGAVYDFGNAVCLSGDSFVIGADREQSSSTGVNGNQSNNSAFDAGAAYVFRDLASPPAYCFGDGSGTSCPCGNVGTPGSGCPNSAYSGGGRLASAGIPSVSSDTFSLRSSSVHPYGPGLFLQGSTSIAAGSNFGDGLLCVTGSVARIEVRFADFNGASSTTVPIHTLGAVTQNDVRYYQLWYRDDPTVCPGFGFNLTNALTVSWSP